MNKGVRTRLRHITRNTIEKSTGEAAPFIGLEDVASGLGRLATGELEFKLATDALVFAPGDVLFSKLRPYLAKSLAPDVAGTCTSELLVMRPGPDLDRRFLLYMTLSAPWLDWAVTTSYGTKMPRTSWEAMADFTVDLPPLDEQRRIANFLDTEIQRLDALARLRSEQSGRLSERAQAVLDVALTRLETDHGVAPLRRELLTIEQGASPQCEAHPAEPGEIGVLKLSAVNNGAYLEHENKALPAGIAGDPRYEVRRGDLLISRANTPERVGDVAFVPETRRGLLLPDLLYRLTLDKPSNAEFIAIALRSTRVRALLSVTARGTSHSMVKLRGEDIASLPVPAAPPIHRERAVRDVREAHETASRAMSRISTARSLLTERRQALITAAVTGQLDVTTARPASP